MLDRHHERARLDDLVGDIRAGQSSKLLLEGGAGVGKTVLLGHLAAQARGIRILSVTGIQSEVTLAYAALHQLCKPLLGLVDGLPAPQRNALQTTFGLIQGPSPDKFLVGLATLALLSRAAEEQALLIIIDDAHWLDSLSAQVLGFVARRLDAESIAMVLAVRTGSDVSWAQAIPRLAVGGLPASDARQLLRSLVPGTVDPRAVERIVDEAEGNPLVLEEVARALRPAEIAAGIMLSRPTRPSELEAHFAGQVEMLPADTRSLLLVAAAEPFADPAAIMRASVRMGIPEGALEPAVRLGLCEPGPMLRFRHPLVRAAVYRSASPVSLRAAHAALAETYDPSGDGVLLAWHRALASTGVDEEAAAELAGAANRVLSRGGPATAAELLRQARAITDNATLRERWTLLTAEAETLAGQFDAAERELLSLSARPGSEQLRAEAKLVGARLAFARARGGASIALFLDAAQDLLRVDGRRADQALLEAMSAALFAGVLSADDGLASVARHWQASQEGPGDSPSAQLMAGLSAVILDEDARALPKLRTALDSYRNAAVVGEAPHELWLACVGAAAAWDLESWDVLSARHVAAVRERGDLSELPIALSSRAFVPLFTGNLDDAADVVAEIETITGVTGEAVSPYGAIGLAAFRGQDAALTALVDRAKGEAERRADGTGVAIAHWGTALLANAAGQYARAGAAAQHAVAMHHSLHATGGWAMVELIEAWSRSDRLTDAREVAARFGDIARASGTRWAMGVWNRAAALVAEQNSAEPYFLESIGGLSGTSARMDLARTNLVYGEWLRRRRRLSDARSRLSAAYDSFTSMGAGAFMARALRELRATGVAAEPPTSRLADLSPQESQIARMAELGLTNGEIAARLYISPRTVEYHLSKVFTKLGIRSRHELRDRKDQQGGAPQPE